MDRPLGGATPDGGGIDRLDSVFGMKKDARRNDIDCSDGLQSSARRMTFQGAWPHGGFKCGGTSLHLNPGSMYP
ncbi:hypothetical protein [Desulfatitalea alkaliphila]|uniref:Uncharacterized protein n=1 Tax=Desulfatitalea alkaliphila TaxID=2929485 RepID=A0AA41UJ10_9BACT|nr:hypothetical protein [Desulfatitalea alkaliphila]MCJ8501360.1 hypothetical protein [Desulfatitalea alkaliphila]